MHKLVGGGVGDLPWVTRRAAGPGPWPVIPEVLLPGRLYSTDEPAPLGIRGREACGVHLHKACAWRQDAHPQGGHRRPCSQDAVGTRVPSQQHPEGLTRIPGPLLTRRKGSTRGMTSLLEPSVSPKCTGLDWMSSVSPGLVFLLLLNTQLPRGFSPRMGNTIPWKMQKYR